MAEGTGAAQALEIAEPPALPSPHQQPTASLTLRSGFALEGEARGGHVGKTPLGSSNSGQVSGEAVHLFLFFPAPSLFSPFNFSFFFQTEVSETPSPVLKHLLQLSKRHPELSESGARHN